MSANRRRPSALASVASDLVALPKVQLENVYRWPLFPELMRVAFGAEELASSWREAISRMATSASVLEIGGGTGRLTTQLARRHRTRRLTVVERDRELARFLRSKVGNTLVDVRECEFPCSGLAKHDVLCLHQNTLLELLNEKGWSIIDSLLDVTNPGGYILADCVQPAISLGQEGVLFDGLVRDETSVSYSYRCIRKSGDFIEAELRYRVSERRSVVHDTEASVLVWLPSLLDIETRFHLAGFRTQRVAIPDGATFFPGQMFLLKCQRES